MVGAMDHHMINYAVDYWNLQRGMILGTMNEEDDSMSDTSILHSILYHKID